MSEIRENTVECLEKLQAIIADSPWNDKYSRELSAFRNCIDEPCVLAVAGRVKVGKSSFINALLKQDVALVGNTETTATINYIRYGQAPNPEKPVRCVWQDGRETWESDEFLDSLQGHTQEVFQRALGIKRIERFLLNPILEHIKLVDTPGIGAVVDSHIEATEEFFQMSKTLRERHTEETESLAAGADALIYLTDHVIQQCDVDFISSFQKKTRIGATEGTALNMIGIIGQADMNDDLLGTLERATDYIQNEANQVNNQLEMPILISSVSAGLQRVLDSLGQDGLIKMQETLRGLISKEDFDVAMDSESIFMDPVIAPNFPLWQRKELIGEMPWRVFRILASTLYNHPYNEAIDLLKRYSGFDNLIELLDRHFFQRAELLRCYSNVTKIMNLVYQLINDEYPKYEEQWKQEQDDIKNFAIFILSHPEFNQNDTGRKLQQFILKNMPVNKSQGLLPKLKAIYQDFSIIKDKLDSVKSNYEALQLIEIHPEGVLEKEREELFVLFGLYPSVVSPDNPLDYFSRRAMYWRQMQDRANSTYRKRIAEMAESQYNRKVCQLNQQEKQSCQI